MADAQYEKLLEEEQRQCLRRLSIDGIDDEGCKHENVEFHIFHQEDERTDSVQCCSVLEMVIVVADCDEGDIMPCLYHGGESIVDLDAQQRDQY